MNLVTLNEKTDLKPGDFWWEFDQNSVAFNKIYVCFPPRPGLKAKYEIHWAPCNAYGDSPESRKWNGDFNRPTIAGSWGIDHFHCWIHEGQMTLEAPNG